jgi:hypothetical protein
MNFIVSNQENLQIHQYTVLIQGISTIFKEQIPTNLVLKKLHFCWHEIVNGLPCSPKILKNEKAKFKLALRKHLNTHSFHSVDEFVYA